MLDFVTEGPKGKGGRGKGLGKGLGGKGKVGPPAMSSDSEDDFLSARTARAPDAGGNADMEAGRKRQTTDERTSVRAAIKAPAPALPDFLRRKSCSWLEQPDFVCALAIPLIMLLIVPCRVRLRLVRDDCRRRAQEGSGEQGQAANAAGGRARRARA